MPMLELTLCTLGCAALCYTLGRYNRAATIARWHFILNLPARRALAALRSQMELDAALARQALDAADCALKTGRTKEAIDVLRAALGVLEEASADRLTRLRGMRVYSRMVRAIQPLPPPTGAVYRTRRLRLLGSVGGFGYRLLVGGAERFRLWLTMLGFGVRIVLHGARNSTAAAARTPRARRPWRQFEDGLSDFQTLDASHLNAFEALSASLAAIDSSRRVRVWDSIVNP